MQEKYFFRKDFFSREKKQKNNFEKVCLRNIIILINISMLKNTLLIIFFM
jgi:hypothetical protein